MALRPQRNILSLCAGVGGLDLGVKLALAHLGLAGRGVVYVEGEAAAASSLVASMEAGWMDQAPIWSDMRTFDAKPWRGSVHILASGDPCQDNSVAGKGAGAGGQRFLAPEVCRIAEECRPILSSAKTSRGTRMDKSRPLSRHWSDWATALRQEYSRRPKPEIPCGGNDCSSWPSAQNHDAQGMPGKGTREKGGRRADLNVAAVNWPGPTVKTGAQTAENPTPNQTGGTSLEGAARQWEAPSVAVTEGSRLTRGGDRSGELLLTGQAMEAAQMWAAPMAADDGHKVTPNSHQNSLIKQAHNFTLPPSSPGRPIAGGSMSSTDGPNSNQPSAKRRLNPIFVEALMRWPTGLSGFERQETAWTRWWQLMPSYLSVLCSRKPDSQTSLFD